jgi:hypothetical protein
VGMSSQDMTSIVLADLNSLNTPSRELKPSGSRTDISPFALLSFNSNVCERQLILVPSSLLLTQQGEKEVQKISRLVRTNRHLCCKGKRDVPVPLDPGRRFRQPPFRASKHHAQDISPIPTSPTSSTA